MAIGRLKLQKLKYDVYCRFWRWLPHKTNFFAPGRIMISTEWPNYNDKNVPNATEFAVKISLCFAPENCSR